MITKTYAVTDGKIIATETPKTPTTAQVTVAQLKNALWLRRTPSAMLASAFHGGQAVGFDLAMSDVKTSEIEQAYAAADPAGAAKARAEYDQFLAEAKAEREAQRSRFLAEREAKTKGGT